MDEPEKEIKLPPVVAYHPKVTTEHSGSKYLLSATVPDYMSDDEFVALVLKHVPNLEEPATGRYKLPHQFGDTLQNLKIEKLD